MTNKKKFINSLIRRAIENQIYHFTKNEFYKSGYCPDITIDKQAEICTTSIMELFEQSKCECSNIKKWDKFFKEWVDNNSNEDSQTYRRPMFDDFMQYLSRKEKEND